MGDIPRMAVARRCRYDQAKQQKLLPMRDDTTSQNPWIYAILLFGVLECLLLALIFFEPTAVNATGISHSTIPAMQIGGDSARFAPVSDYAWWLQVIVLAQAHCLAALGVSQDKRTPAFLGLLGLSYLAALLVWWQMVTTYETYVTTGETTFFFGFPVPTAWQTYGQFFSGACLIALYSLGFRHFIYSNEDEAKFTALSEKVALKNQTSDSEA